MPELQITESVATLRAEAEKLWIEGQLAEKGIMELFDVRLDRAWRLGKVFRKIKASVGHGNWLLWLEGNLPDLSDRLARTFMCLDADNPDAKSIADLSPDSVRKFRLGYVPAKERPQLPGDQHAKPVTHHLTFVNHWRLFLRHVELGKASLDIEEARHDLRPLFDWMRKELFAEEGAEA